MQTRTYVGVDNRVSRQMCISQVLNVRLTLYLQWKQPCLRRKLYI